MRNGMLVSAFALFCGSCASYNPDAVCDVNDTTGLPILRPAAYQKNINTSQHVTINSRNGKFEFISQLEIDSSRLVLVAMSVLGQKLFQVDYQQGKVNFVSWGVPLDFDAGYLLTDISFIFGPHDKLETCLRQINTGLHFISDNESLKRQITGSDFSGTVSYSTQSPWSGIIHYQNTTLNYKIDINILESSSL